MDPRPAPLSADELLEHASWIRGLANGLVRDPAVGEDLSQEAWLAALRRRPGRERPLGPWLARVVRNQAALWRRRGRAQADRERSSAASEALPSALDLVIRAETQRALVDAVLELEEPYRSVVLLRYYEDLAPSEIAHRKGVPAATVRTQLRRGLERLRLLLDRQFDGDRRAWIVILSPLAGSRAPTFELARNAAATGQSTRFGWLGLALASAVVVTGVAGWSAFGGSEPPENASRSGVAERSSPAGSSVLPVAERAGRRPGPGVGGARRTARVLDAETLEPVPHFALVLTGPDGGQHALVSGAGGALELSAEMGPGSYEVHLFDTEHRIPSSFVVHGEWHERTVPKTNVVFSDGPDGTPIEVRVGPTYHLDLELPAGYSAHDFRAQLAMLGRCRFRTERWEQHVGPLRVGSAGPWVRLGELELDFLGGEPPWELSVRSRDDRWQGRAEVRTIRGVHPGRIPIALELTAGLRGTVSDSRGPVTTDVSLKLQGADGDHVCVAVHDTDELGQYAIAALDPGPYRLHVSSPRHGGRELELLLEGGRETELDVVLDALPEGGAVHGRLSSRTGTFHSPVAVVLTPARGLESGGELFANVAWEPAPSEEGYVASFGFDDVPRGEYEVAILSIRDQLNWTFSERTISPPAEVSLVCQDLAPRSDLGFRVLDLERGELIDRYAVVFRCGDGPVIRLSPQDAKTGQGSTPTWTVGAAGLVWSYVSGPAPIRAFPEGGAIVWCVRAEGYEPVFGDERAFPPEGAVRLAEVALRRGWGLRLELVGDPGGHAVRGARVVGDGVPLGSTGADGRVELACDAQPSEITIEHPDWVLPGGPLRPEEAFRPARLLHQVRLARRSPPEPDPRVR